MDCVKIVFALQLLIAGKVTSQTTQNFTYGSVQPKLISCSTMYQPVYPSTLDELKFIVNQALGMEQIMTLKPLGKLNSGSDLICTQGLPIFMSSISHFSYDESTEIVTVGSGATLHYLLGKLHNLGRTLPGLPAYGDITVGGALGVGAHGTGKLTDPGILSDSVVSIVLVDGWGLVRNISEPERLKPFKAHLGLLGIIYEVQLKTIPQYKIQMRHFEEPDELLFKENGRRILDYVESSDRFMFWWFPSLQSVVLSVGSKFEVEEEGNCETHYIPEISRWMSGLLAVGLEYIQSLKALMKLHLLQVVFKETLVRIVPGWSFIFSEGNSPALLCRKLPPVGFSHKMEMNRCEKCLWSYGEASALSQEFSMGVPVEELGSALNTIRGILEEYPTAFPFSGIYVRFVQKSDGFLAINEGRDTAVIEWVLNPRRNRFEEGMVGLAASQAMSQALLDKHQGRPHWTKNGLYYSQKQVVEKAYPEYNSFLGAMEEYDPHGLFLNEIGVRLKYGKNETAMDKFVKHCALVDYCICENDGDCGIPTREGSLKCRELKGYQVCKGDQDINANARMGLGLLRGTNYFRRAFNLRRNKNLFSSQQQLPFLRRIRNFWG